MRILIVGAGGVGGYFGARLATAGGDVTFLVRPRRGAMLKAAGLRLESPLGNWAGPVRTLSAERLAAPFDLVVLACKAYDLGTVLADIRPAVAEGTALLPFLNGIAHLDQMAEAYPEAELWGGVAHIAAATAPDGTILHLNRLARFLFAPLSPSVGAERAQALQRSLEGMPITVQAAPDIRQAMWDKLVFLASLAGATSLMRADIGAILATGTGERLIDDLLGECRAIAAAEGHTPEAAALAAYRAQLTDPASRATASMLRDIRAGGPTEGDHVLGDLTRRAARHGIAAPALQLCLANLQAYEIIRERRSDG